MRPIRPIQRVTSPTDLENVTFTDNLAEIEVPIECIDLLPLKNEDRSDSARLRIVERAIRNNGYNNFNPIVAYLGRRGRWVIVDGGHRLTAARHVSKEFFTNLFGRKVRTIRFLLQLTPISNSLTKRDQAEREAAANEAANGEGEASVAPAAPTGDAISRHCPPEDGSRQD